MALGTVSFSTWLPCLCFGDSVSSEVEGGYRGWNEGDVSVGTAFSEEESAWSSFLHACLVFGSSVWVRIGVLIWNLKQGTTVKNEIWKPPRQLHVSSWEIDASKEHGTLRRRLVHWQFLLTWWSFNWCFKGVERCCWKHLDPYNKADGSDERRSDSIVSKSTRRKSAEDVRPVLGDFCLLWSQLGTASSMYLKASSLRGTAGVQRNILPKHETLLAR